MRGTRGAAVLLISLCVALPLLFAACGGGNAEGLPVRKLPENATPEKIMLEGLNATDGVGTLHYLFEYSFIVPPTGKQTYTAEVAISGEGDYDYATKNSRAHVNWKSFDIELDYVLFDGVQYMRTEESGPWYELPGQSGLSIPSVSEITRNTAEYLDNFQKITRLQDEVVDGRDCFHIAMVPNFDAIMEDEDFLNMIKGDREELDEETLAKLEELKRELREASVNYEYWFDKEYLVLRRTLYNIEMVKAGGENDPGFTVKLIMHMRFPNYNQKVDIARPEPVEARQS